MLCASGDFFFAFKFVFTAHERFPRADLSKKYLFAVFSLFLIAHIPFICFAMMILICRSVHATFKRPEEWQKERKKDILIHQFAANKQERQATVKRHGDNKTAKMRYHVSLRK